MRKSPGRKESRKPKSRKDTAIAQSNHLQFTAPDCNCPSAHIGRHTVDCPTYDVWEHADDLSDELIADAIENGDPYLAALATLAARDDTDDEMDISGKPGYVVMPDGSIVEHSGHLTPRDDAPIRTYDIDDWSGVLGKWQCEHDRDPYTLSDGSIVYATAWTDTPAVREWEPDLAAYADPAWIPECPAYHIGWPDYSIPKPTIKDVVFMMEHLLSTAREGFRSEVGCMGGHGRTGTMLAILDILSTKGTSSPIGAKAAIKRVRKNHCHRAIEGPMQEWYIRAAHAVIFGNPLPPKPRPKKNPPVIYVKGSNVIANNGGNTPTNSGNSYTADASGRMTWHRSELEIPGSALRGDILVLSNGERFLIVNDYPGDPNKRLIQESSAEAGAWLAAWAKEREEAIKPTGGQTPLEKAREAAAKARARRDANNAANAPVAVTDGVKMIVSQTPNGPVIRPNTAKPYDATAGARVPSVESTFRNPETGELETVRLPIQTHDGEV